MLSLLATLTVTAVLAIVGLVYVQQMQGDIGARFNEVGAELAAKDSAQRKARAALAEAVRRTYVREEALSQVLDNKRVQTQYASADRQVARHLVADRALLSDATVRELNARRISSRSISGIDAAFETMSAKLARAGELSAGAATVRGQLSAGGVRAQSLEAAQVVMGKMVSRESRLGSAHADEATVGKLSASSAAFGSSALGAASAQTLGVSGSATAKSLAAQEAAVQGHLSAGSGAFARGLAAQRVSASTYCINGTCMDDAAWKQLAAFAPQAQATARSAAGSVAGIDLSGTDLNVVMADGRKVPISLAAFKPPPGKPSVVSMLQQGQELVLTLSDNTTQRVPLPFVRQDAAAPASVSSVTSDGKSITVSYSDGRSPTTIPLPAPTAATGTSAPAPKAVASIAPSGAGGLDVTMTDGSSVAVQLPQAQQGVFVKSVAPAADGRSLVVAFSDGKTAGVPLPAPPPAPKAVASIAPSGAGGLDVTMTDGSSVAVQLPQVQQGVFVKSVAPAADGRSLAVAFSDGSSASVPLPAPEPGISNIVANADGTSLNVTLTSGRVINVPLPSLRSAASAVMVKDVKASADNQSITVTFSDNTATSIALPAPGATTVAVPGTVGTDVKFTATTSFRGGRSAAHNPNNEPSMLSASDGKNYLRGDTVIAGNVVAMGSATAGQVNSGSTFCLDGECMDKPAWRALKGLAPKAGGVVTGVSISGTNLNVVLSNGATVPLSLAAFVPQPAKNSVISMTVAGQDMELLMANGSKVRVPLPFVRQDALPRPPASVTAVAVTPDQQALAVAYSDGRAPEVMPLPPHVRSLQASTDGNIDVFLSNGKQVQLALPKPQAPSAIKSVAVSQDGKSLVTTMTDGAAGPTVALPATVSNLQMSADGASISVLFSNGQQAQLALPKPQAAQAAPKAIKSVAVSQDGKGLVTVMTDDTAGPTVTLPQPVLPTSFSADITFNGKVIIAGATAGNPTNVTTTFAAADGNNWIGGNTQVVGSVAVQQGLSVKGPATIKGARSEHNAQNEATVFNAENGLNMIRGDTAIWGNVTHTGDLRTSRNLIADGSFQTKGGKSVHNPNNWSTHLPFPGDGKNYIRGDTELRGNVDLIGDLQVGNNVKANRVLLGNKWSLSGVGDGIGNDEWLRLQRSDGRDYGGGLAAGKLYARDWLSTQNLEVRGTINGPRSCRQAYTPWSDNGDGNWQFMDRHRIECSEEENLVGWKMEIDRWNENARFWYKCCKR